MGAGDKPNEPERNRDQSVAAGGRPSGDQTQTRAQTPAQDAPTVVRTAIVPVAGGQAAFLPASKIVPREMLPIVDKPIVQYAIEEARAAGIERFVFVERSGETTLRRHLARDELSERRFDDREDADRFRSAALPDGAALFVPQDGGPGLGRAVAAAEPHIGDEPFAVILPDDVILADPPVLAQMTRLYPRFGGAMIAGIEVTRREVARYGIMNIDDTGGDVVAVTGLEEKPDSNLMRSNFAVTGRYILPPQIFNALRAAEPDARGALQLTDAIAALVGGLPIHGVRYQGERYDCGAPEGLVRANIAVALRRPEMRAEILSQLRRSLDRADRETERAAERVRDARGRPAAAPRATLDTTYGAPRARTATTEDAT